MMEELISIFSAAPIVLSVVAFLTSLVLVTRRARAETEFVIKLSEELRASIKRQKDMVEEAQNKNEPLRSGNQIFHINSNLEEIEPGEVRYSIKLPERTDFSNEFYHIYFSSVKGLGENKELPMYVKEALHNLSKNDKRHIVKALSQPSARGRMRYFDKVFKLASKAIRSNGASVL